MTAKNITAIVLVAIITVGIVWCIRQTTYVPVKPAEASMSANADAQKINQVESPKAPRVPAKAGTDAASAEAFDVQTNLKTTIPDIVHLVGDGDVIGLYKTYTPPAEIDPLHIEQLQKQQEEAHAFAAQHPELQQRIQQGDQQMNEWARQNWEALEQQTPTYNASGDEATYQFTMSGSAGKPGAKFPMTFIKIDGKWYLKSGNKTSN